MKSLQQNVTGNTAGKALRNGTSQKTCLYAMRERPRVSASVNRWLKCVKAFMSFALGIGIGRLQKSISRLVSDSCRSQTGFLFAWACH